MCLNRRLGRCWQSVPKGLSAPGEEVAPGTPTGFVNGLVVAWLQEACEPHKTVRKNLKVHRDIFSTSTNLCQF